MSLVHTNNVQYLITQLINSSDWMFRYSLNMPFSFLVTWFFWYTLSKNVNGLRMCKMGMF